MTDHDTMRVVIGALLALFAYGVGSVVAIVWLLRSTEDE